MRVVVALLVLIGALQFALVVPFWWFTSEMLGALESNQQQVDDFDRQTRAIDEERLRAAKQLDEYEAQLRDARRQIEQGQALMVRQEVLLGRQERNAARYEALLTKWEQQAEKPK